MDGECCAPDFVHSIITRSLLSPMSWLKRTFIIKPPYFSATGDQINRPLTDAASLHHQHNSGKIPRFGYLPHRVTLCRQGSPRYIHKSDRTVTVCSFGATLTPIRVSLTVSLESILHDIRTLERGMEMAKKEFLVQDDSPVLKGFIKTNSKQLESLIKDGKTAQVSLQSAGQLISCQHIVSLFLSPAIFLQEAYGSVVEYFGENPKTTQPSMFFPLFGRFLKAYKVRLCDRFFWYLGFFFFFCSGSKSCTFVILQTAQQEIEQKKKLESQNSEEKEPSSPNKAGVHKVWQTVQPSNTVWTFHPRINSL